MNCLQFSGELESKDVMESAKIKVTKTLEDLFEGRDTSQDFLNYLTFNNYGAKFSSVNDFKMYQKPNKLGYNAKVTYTIITRMVLHIQLPHIYLLLSQIRLG